MRNTRLTSFASLCICLETELTPKTLRPRRLCAPGPRPNRLRWPPLRDTCSPLRVISSCSSCAKHPGRGAQHGNPRSFTWSRVGGGKQGSIFDRHGPAAATSGTRPGSFVNERFGRRAVYRYCAGAGNLPPRCENENPSFAARVEPTGAAQMTDIPKELVLDLLPLYLAGETSPATREWLKAYLDQNPELAERARRQPSNSEIFGPALPPVLPDGEMLVLRRTQRMLAALRWLFAWAIAFTAIALAMEITFRPFHLRLLLFHYPAHLGPVLVAGAICWTAYFALRRRLRTTGR